MLTNLVQPLVNSRPPEHIAAVLGHLLWQGIDAQMNDGVHWVSHWDMTAQLTPDYEVDQQNNW